MISAHQRVVTALKAASQKALQAAAQFPPAHPTAKASKALAERLEAAATIHSQGVRK